MPGVPVGLKIELQDVLGGPMDDAGDILVKASGKQVYLKLSCSCCKQNFAVSWCWTDYLYRVKHRIWYLLYLRITDLDWVGACYYGHLGIHLGLLLC